MRRLRPARADPRLFTDRADAGRRLLDTLRRDAVPRPDLILAVPRGGVPIGALLAEAMHLPLDILVARKVGAPGQAELAIGAVTRFGAVWNEPLLDRLALAADDLSRREADAVEEVVRRERLYRGERPPLRVEGRTVLVVDDGLATGATMAAAVQALQRAGAARVTVGVPVASPEGLARIERIGGRVVSVATPRDFLGVGQFYRDFRQLTDQECIETLRSSARRSAQDEASGPGD